MRLLRDAARALRANPLLSLVAVLSLGLGIGANTAIFTLVDRLMLRRLPVSRPEQVALIGAESRSTLWSYRVYESIQARSSLFAGAAAWGSETFNLAEAGEADLIEGLWVSGSFFPLLGVRAAQGRLLTPADDGRGGGAEGPVVVISDAFRQRRLADVANVVGHPIRIHGVDFTIVGVTSPEFFGVETGQTFDIALPLGALTLTRSGPSPLDNVQSWLSVLVRLRDGQTLAAVTASLRAVQREITEESVPPAMTDDDRGEHYRQLHEPFTAYDASRGSSYLRDRYAEALISLSVVSGAVLLVACGNIAMLLLGRAIVRRHELSLRRALGATQWVLAGSLFAESLLIAVLGSAVGVGTGLVGSRLLARELSTDGMPITLDLGIDWHVLAFSTAVAVASAVLFGTLPALRGTRVQPGEVLKEQVRGSSSRRGRLGGALVVAQVAFSLTLVTTAGLFVRTLRQLTHLELGFDGTRVVLVSVDARQSHVPATERPALYERLRQAVLTIPGVEAAGASRITPVSGNTWDRVIDERTGRGLPEQERRISMNLVTPGWFDAYRMPLLAGRDFEPRDDRSAPAVVVVSESFARRFMGGLQGGAVGQTVLVPGALGGEPSPAQIIGIAPDAVYRALRDERPPTIYVPLAQRDAIEPGTTLSVRAAPGAGTSPAFRRRITVALNSVDPTLGLSFRMLSRVIDDSMVQERVVAILATCSAALTLLLAGLGLYGVTAYHTRRRRSEMGIRLALGASSGGVLRLVLRGVAWQLGLGIAIGAVVSWWAARFTASMLYGVAPRDPLTFATGAALLAAVGLVAAWVPARGASRVDPATVMRDR